ncbi:HDOD domain-containing protein [Marinomonas epiphytica]
MQVQDLLKHSEKLPNVPDVVRELIQLLSNPDADYGVIAGKVARDQTISLKVLRVVNSAYFGLSRKVSSLDEATVLLGMDKLKTLVIATGFASSVSEVEGIKLKDFWSDSFRVAELAKWLAERTDLVNPDEAFTAGIVHNIGRLLIHLAEPEMAMKVQDMVASTGVSRIKAETDVFGFTSQTAGKTLMDFWKLPSVLTDAVGQHKRPFADGDPLALACVLNLASYLNACIRTERDSDLVREAFPMAVAKGAGLSEDILLELDEAMGLGQDLDQLLI